MSEPYTSGYVWWCGDYICDCTQALISRFTPREVTMPMGHRITVWDEERLWEGEFHSAGEGDAKADLEAARQYLEALAR